jgi:hypothetical protein
MHSNSLERHHMTGPNVSLFQCHFSVGRSNFRANSGILVEVLAETMSSSPIIPGVGMCSLVGARQTCSVLITLLLAPSTFHFFNVGPSTLEDHTCIGA